MKMFIRLFICLFFLGGGALAQDISPILKFGLFADTQYADCPSEMHDFIGRHCRNWILASIISISRMSSLLLIWGILLTGRTVI